MNDTKRVSKEQIVLRLPTDIHAWLKAKADAADRSFNYVAVQALQQVKAEEGQKEAA